MKTIFTIMLLLASIVVWAQTNGALSGFNFELSGEAAVGTYKNQECIHIKNGTATIKDLELKDGVIEFDMCVQPQRGFAGVRFRTEGDNAEEFYIRMHQSGNSDAMQYSPVYNNDAAWQLYYGDGYGAAKAYRFDEWFHIKLAIAGKQGEVYIDDMETPVLAIHELKRGLTEGGIQFYGPARFANLKVSDEVQALKSSFKTSEKAGQEVVQSYRVSNSFSMEELLKASTMKEGFVSSLNFKKSGTESNGLINLSSIQRRTQKENSVLIEFDITSDEDLLKELEFGYSDIAKLFVNGKAIYMGNNTYRTRDYRYLGTIGYFDAVYLPLKKGGNTVSVMVAENFGGWGFQCRFLDLQGIHIQ